MVLVFGLTTHHSEAGKDVRRSSPAILKWSCFSVPWLGLLNSSFHRNPKSVNCPKCQNRFGMLLLRLPAYWNMLARERCGGDMRRPGHVYPVQANLFDPPSDADSGWSNQRGESAFDPKTPDDEDVIAWLPDSNLARAEALCEQVLSRGLADAAVPALEELWDRFRGFGINSPCREQLAVLGTLAKIETRRSRAAVRRISEERCLPAVLLPHALQAAVASRIRFSPRRIELWIKSEQPIVRAQAFTLAQWVAPPVWVLEEGRNDPDRSVRRAALITMGKLGHAAARPGLLALFASNPNADIVRALATIANDEVITRFGRCANEHEGLRPLILEELGAMDDPRATAIVNRMLRR